MARKPTTTRPPEQLPQELVNLRKEITQLAAAPRDRLLPLCERLAQYTALQNRLVRIAQDAVDQLQLDVKYLQFDLEVTQRERDALLRHLSELEGDDN